MIELSQHDVTMRVRLADAVDIIAIDGKYHVQCWVEN